jgi:murein DD-endopeptidase MepM/ murein hydrolase activator NlpD
MPLTLWGELTQGSLILGRIAPESEVALNGQVLAVTPEGFFVFGFGRDDALQHRLSWRASGQTGWFSHLLQLTAREYAIQRVDGVPEQTVTPAPDRLARIEQETTLLEQARQRRITRSDFTAPFQVPLKGPITGVYGSQRIYNGAPKRPHYGLDYAAPVGAVVQAPMSGVVTLSHPDMFYSGGTLIIDHGYGVSSTFIHLSEIMVREGEEIQLGQPIARVGAGGRASGPHLDWRINWHQVRIDPQRALQREAHRLELPPAGSASEQALSAHP